MRVRFYAEKRRGEDGELLTKQRPVFMTVAFNGKRVLIPTRIFVDLQWWDPVRQRVKDASSDSNVNNQWLDSLAYTAGVVWKALANLSENPGVGEFKREFEKLRPRFSAGFFDVLLLFIEKGSDHWNKSTYSNVRAFYSLMKSFENEAGYVIRYNTLDARFFEKFIRYQHAQECAPGTIRKMTNILVWYMNWATDKGFNVYPEYRQFYKMLNRSEIMKSKTFLYLHWNELMKLSEHSYEDINQERIVDLFCFMCMTGLRYTEAIALKKTDIETSFVMVRKKGKPDRKVPLSRHARRLLAKYKNRYYQENTALPPATMMTLNKHIRLAASSCGLDRMVEDPRNPGEIKPLHQVLTAGIAVQTFIMNALRLEIPVEVIPSFTGIEQDHRIQLLKQEIAEKEIEKFNLL